MDDVTDDHRPSRTTNPEPWLYLLHAPGLGARGIRRLLHTFGDADAILRRADEPGLELAPDTRAWLRAPDPAAIAADLAWLEAPDHHLLTLTDPRYPELLARIADPPPLLFVHGDPDLLCGVQLAMVGSRNPTPSGRRTARDFARHLAGAGIVITSGLASGIDAAAHQGALEVNGRTVAVAGTGLDRVYPAAHRELAHRIAASGALVSEYPPGTPPARGNFPRRNRIISGLTLGSLVVEAAAQSGSLITARLAAEQGREVFAIPGSIHNPLARGCHGLIRQGAKLVETAADIVEELGPLLGHLDQPPPAPLPRQGPPKQEWDADYQRLLGALGHDPEPVDVLIARSGLTAEAVSSMLLLLELEGYVDASAGNRYSLTGKHIQVVAD